MPSHPVLPLDGIRKDFRQRESAVRAGFALCGRAAGAGAAHDIASIRRFIGRRLKADYFASSDLNGQPVLTRVDPQIDFDWNAASPAPACRRKNFGVRWTGTIYAPAPETIRSASHWPTAIPARITRVTRFISTTKSRKLSQAMRSRTLVRVRRRNFTCIFPTRSRMRFAVEYDHNAPVFGAGITLNWTASGRAAARRGCCRGQAGGRGARLCGPVARA